jgi:hypothetical protein
MEPIFGIVFPTKFYEYIACDKPIIAICKGELSEVINFNKIGLAVDKENIEDKYKLSKILIGFRQSSKRYDSNISLSSTYLNTN